MGVGWHLRHLRWQQLAHGLCPGTKPASRSNSLVSGLEKYYLSCSTVDQWQWLPSLFPTPGDSALEISWGPGLIFPGGLGQRIWGGEGQCHPPILCLTVGSQGLCFGSEAVSPLTPLWDPAALGCVGVDEVVQGNRGSNEIKAKQTMRNVKGQGVKKC